MKAAAFIAARKELGISQAKLADALGLSVRQISGMETGEREIPRVYELALLGLKHEHLSAAPSNRIRRPK